jgi:hypothetical protein
VSRGAFLELIDDLPFRIRDNLEGYVLSIEQAAPEIFTAAGVDFTTELRDQLVFMAGVRKMWLLVDSQYQVLSRSLLVLEANQVALLQVGGTTYGSGRRVDGFTTERSADGVRATAAYLEIQRFRDDFRTQLADMQLDVVVQISSLEELLQRIARS